MKNIGCKKHMNTKAISPVIATVIIVSVAIAIAVAVAFWMTGIAGIFTRYEKLEVVTAYATTPSGVNWEWNVVIIVKNTGSTDTTIDDIFINGKPWSSWTTSYSYNNTLGLPEPISAGETEKFIIPLDEDDGFVAGQSIEVKVHTASGREYPRSVQLP